MWLQKMLWLSVVLISFVKGTEVHERAPRAEARVAYSSISEKSMHPLPGLLYPRESESREVRYNYIQ